jgi:hypothetical protein
MLTLSHPKQNLSGHEVANLSFVSNYQTKTTPTIKLEVD